MTVTLLLARDDDGEAKRPLMASSRKVLLLAVVAAAVVSLASATQWMVGDEGGWRANFNESGWADGKTFVVGDSLQFVYPKETHTVVMVGQDAFESCDVSADLQLGNWTSGNDVVELDTPGTVWFICNVPDHCLDGMKLAIDVVDGGTTAPAPSPSTFPGFPPAPAPAPAPSPFPFPGVQAPAPAPPPAPSAVPRWPSHGGSAPVSPPAAPPSAAVRNSVGGAVAVAVAAMVAAALAL